MDKELKIRLDKDLHTLIVLAAHKLGLSVSAFVRLACLERAAQMAAETKRNGE